MRRVPTALLALAVGLTLAPLSARQAPPPSTRPETPFKLATFEAGGRTRVGLTSGAYLVDIAAANEHVTKIHGLQAVAMPADMAGLIEAYDRVAPRLYQIANGLAAAKLDGLPFAFAAEGARFRPPIMYPSNFLNIAANYRAHAEGMAGGGTAAGPRGGTQPAAPPAGAGGRAGGGFNAAAAADIVPDRDGPIVFAKSARSCIIATGEPFYIPEGNLRIDYEGELGVVIGRRALNVAREQALDHVFGWSIVHDVSDRGGRQRRVVSMFPGTNWFDGKSIDRGGPFGPYIVPKEFLKADSLRLVTRVNGVVKQDQRTSDMIWSVAHQIAYISRNMTLYPGDLIATGTPAGTGAERNEFLKPGDVVTIEIEGIGTLTTPFQAEADRPRGGTE